LPIHRPCALPCLDRVPAAWLAPCSGHFVLTRRLEGRRLVLTRRLEGRRLVLTRRLEGRLGVLNAPSKIRGPPWREAPDQLTHSPLTFARERDDLASTL